MHDITPALMDEIRGRFAHVDTCPFGGERVFFENAGGALTLNAVVETSARMAAIPDNQGRDNAASKALQDMIDTAKRDMQVFFNTPDTNFFVGESGTELLFRLIRAACLGSQRGRVVGSSLEHPATRSACDRWAKVAGKPYVVVPHDNATGSVTASDYAAELTPDTVVATILHTSPVTGMSVDVALVAQQIRSVAPDCFIIVDGIQHAAHGRLDIAAYDVDGYVISPYKVFSRHGYGVAWVSGRLADLPHDHLVGAPNTPWDLGTRDTGAFATFSDVVAYFDWLGAQVSDSDDRRSRIMAAGEAIHAQEAKLTQAMLHGTGNLKGLAEFDGVTVLGGVDNPLREGLVSFALHAIPAPDVVSALSARGVRVHTRKADHYSANILEPLGMEHCVRVSVCHYNTEAEVARFLQAMADIADEAG